MRRATSVATAVLGVYMTTIALGGDYPYAPVGFPAVKITDEFWAPRIETNRTVTIPYDLRKCEQTGRIDNFAKAGGLMSGAFRGIPYDDSDVYKVIEGAAYSLSLHPDAELERYLDELIARIAAAQEPDGYLYTARTIHGNSAPGRASPQRWLNERGALGQGDSHELYNAGHLYEAAVAYYQATGKRCLLEVALRNADLVAATWGPGRLEIPSGHPEIEIGLVKLYWLTQDEKYLALARFLLDCRGRGTGEDAVYYADHKPVVDQTEAVGHAVRSGYLYSAMTDMAALTGDERYRAAVDRLWENVVSRKMYITGGVGARGSGEAFGDDYELPNRSAYAETCAAIAQMLWNQRLFLLHGDSRYVDVLERILYNGFLAGVSLSGDRFFYPNPLESDGRTPFNYGHCERAPWFECSCCPVNIVRILPQLGGWIYATRDGELYVNLYVGSRAEIRLSPAGHDAAQPAGGDGPADAIRLVQETRYPWDGAVRLTIDPAAPRELTLCLRIPGWVLGRPVPSDLYRYLDQTPGDVRLAVNGQTQDIAPQRGYARIRRIWNPGDVVTLELPMPIRRVAAHPKVAANRGRTAIERGPIVYCAEGVDNGGQVFNKFLPARAALRPAEGSTGPGGSVVLRAAARELVRDAAGAARERAVELTLVPYFAWANRGATQMQVWLATDASGVRLPPLPTIASRSRARASHCYACDTLDALADQLEPAGSADQDIPRMTFWPHRGTAEWLEYELAEPATVWRVAVYWFDDTGRGACRVPAAWRLLVRPVGGSWQPAAGAGQFGVEKDRFNEVAFEPVRAEALRIELQLQEGYSAGVLEWRVE